MLWSMAIETNGGTMTVRELAVHRGKLGGVARARSLSPRRRQEIARMGGKMRVKMQRIRESAGLQPVMNRESVGNGGFETAVR